MLENIVQAKLRELAARREELPRRELAALAARQSPPLDFAAALSSAKRKPALIAEVKRASPSAGPLRPGLDAAALARLYARGGASAVSVLTEESYFQGSLEDMHRVKQALGPLGIPVLRKDFILEPYQVYESRAWGADAILLIVAILNQGRLSQLLELAKGLRMACLVEVHSENELQAAVGAGARIIGVNNRDLTTFSVDIGTTKRLRPLVPGDRLVVSESGIKGPADVEMLRRWNVDAMLVGEALVRAEDLLSRMKEFQ